MSQAALSVCSMARAIEFVLWTIARGGDGWTLSDLPNEWGIRTVRGLRPYVRAMLLARMEMALEDGRYYVTGRRLLDDDDVSAFPRRCALRGPSAPGHEDAHG